MIVYLANKTRFREDILSKRIEEIVHVSFGRQKSGIFSNNGENQIKELIDASTFSA